MIPRRIVWHHSAIGTNSPQLEKINLYHKSRQFPKSKKGYYVGYHVLIEPDGSIVRCREDDEIGAHDAGENVNSLGICLAGSFDVNPPADIQAAAAARVVAEWCRKWKIPITRIEPHRWDDATTCPGAALSDDWLTQQYLEREASLAGRLFWQLGRVAGFL